jgi:hypothetical protein
MSKASVERFQRESAELAVQRQLLGDVALGTILDPDLHRSVVARPHCVDAISKQVLHFATLAAKAKASSLALLGNAMKKGATVRDLDGSASTPLQAHIVVFGLGGVGTHVVETLLASKRFHPTAISVVTRQSTFPTAFASCGVRCFNDAACCLGDADVLLFCCQPGQFPAVAKTVRESQSLKPSCIAMSVCAGISSDKAAAQLGHVSCIAADINVSTITKNAAEWHREDAAVSRQRRLEFAAQKSVTRAHQGGGVVATDAALELESDESRRERRRKEGAEASFFADGCAFVQRAVHALAASVVARGGAPHAGLRIGIRLVLGVDPTVDDRIRDLVEASRAASLQVAVEAQQPTELVSRALSVFLTQTALYI